MGIRQTIEKDLYYEHYEPTASKEAINEYQVLLDDFINWCIKERIFDDEKIKEEYKKMFKTNCSVLWWIKKEINRRIKNESATNN